MLRFAAMIVWLNFTRCLLWNVGGPIEGEWMLWAGDYVYCGGRYMVAANWDAEGWTFTLVDDADREYEAECWEWRIGK